MRYQPALATFLLGSLTLVSHAFATPDDGEGLPGNAERINAMVQGGKWWALDAGAYLPVDAKVRERFGSTLFRFGLRPYQSRAVGKFKSKFDTTFITAYDRGDHILAIPVTFGFTGSSGTEQEKQIWFWGVGAGPAYFHYQIDRHTGPNQITTYEGSSFGWGAHGEVGVTLDNRTTFTLRYDWLSKQDIFDFSGVSFGVSMRLFKW